MVLSKTIPYIITHDEAEIFFRFGFHFKKVYNCLVFLIYRTVENILLRQDSVFHWVHVRGFHCDIINGTKNIHIWILLLLFSQRSRSLKKKILKSVFYIKYQAIIFFFNFFVVVLYFCTVLHFSFIDKFCEVYCFFA